MKNDNEKKQIPDINEEFMMNLMVDGVKKDGLAASNPISEERRAETPVQSVSKFNKKTLVKDKKKIKRNMNTEYESIFFKRTDTQARDGKTVYIRPDFHEKLTRIVQVIGQDKISIYAYLDNLLDYHFQEFGESITTSFNEKYKPIL